MSVCVCVESKSYLHVVPGGGGGGGGGGGNSGISTGQHDWLE